MDVPAADNHVAHAIAQALIDGFNRHYRIFSETSRSAKQRFEQADWQGELRAVRERVQFYDDRVNETVMRLRGECHADGLDDRTWQQAKLLYIGFLINHKQPELAETFFNSVCCKILHRTYFHNDYIFARPAISTEYIQSYPPTYSSYYPHEGGMRATVRRVIEDFAWQVPFEDLQRDVEHILRSIESHLNGWPAREVNCQIQVLYSPFYRNKAAYIIGKAINGYVETPFAVVIRHNTEGRLYADTILLEPWRISLLFSLSRAYFLVDMEVPSGYVHFLRSIMPNKPRSEIYTMLGLGKQGKTMFFRDLVSHLLHSNDQFIVAPGIRGMVMAVFTLPSYPYVFKIIKDQRAIQKEMDRATVKRKYQMVKQVDRVGRMADTLEFSDAALPRHRFHPDLIAELRDVCADSVEEEGDTIVIKHLYIERRLTPLNLFLEQADEAQTDHAVQEYGSAIREMAQANIFPGDMLWKNFGVTRYGRVVFYDYDEIEFMTDCNFRRIPPAPNEEMEMSGEVWYSVARNDVFPEEFGTFLLGLPKVRHAFMKYHRDLLDAAFWQGTQARIREGYVEDFFPYPQRLRFCQLYGTETTKAPDGEAELLAEAED
ncbi:bifunctional isocitrate dehydrogenase kinase/phosphatase [Niveibacterium sp. 24ML]|uniref:bifunctional isocitrate dehydrogenase kinase/phosphatase n=1 Tax=Niveibacterium sp. 24ML TaxID=2985512 RepID=UPI0022700B01|nr:bifunctional isocitrate dehydrogenase kinase/phosphatase [Niveibacterium sp. 24ML]MCX9155256.1 bifunctional isocitrate dehydrogenase kinase/phosphatase [Niveibacterium sp. 24ML]